MNDRLHGVIIVILIAIIFSVVGICIYKVCTTQETTTQVEDSDDMLIEIESHFSYAILYDKDTKVLYYRGMAAEGDLCPLYNADGSLKLYSGGNNND